jgi:hypothetical protein
MLSQMCVGKTARALAIGSLGIVLSHSQPRAQQTADHTAAVIDAAVRAGQFQVALQAYDERVKATGKPDRATLAVIARGMLRDRAARRRDEPSESVPALERLARSGDTDALETLRALARKTQGFSADPLAPLLALSRLGDAGVQAQLGERLVTAPAEQRVAMLEAIEAARAIGAGERIASFLQDGTPGVRAAAARAAGTLRYTKAIPSLERMLRDDAGVVRMFAAVALKRLGQTDGDALVSTMLQSSVPEDRLMAAAAFEQAPSGPWLGPVKDLLNDRNSIYRVRAARMLACCDRPAAKLALESAVAEQNPAVRAEAAEALEETRLMQLVLARRLLADPSPAIYVPAAGGILDAAAGPR